MSFRKSIICECFTLNKIYILVSLKNWYLVWAWSAHSNSDKNNNNINDGKNNNYDNSVDKTTSACYRNIKTIRVVSGKVAAFSKALRLVIFTVSSHTFGTSFPAWPRIITEPLLGRNSDLLRLTHFCSVYPKTNRNIQDK